MTPPEGDRLAIALTLTIGEDANAIAPGDVKSFELSLLAFGFEGQVEFLVGDDQVLGGPRTDALLQGFLKPDLMDVSISIQAVLTGETDKPVFTALSVKGLALEKKLVELPVESAAKTGPVLYRRYTVRFQDAAALLWRQHHPCALYTDKTLTQVIDDHKGEKIALTYDWDDVLRKELPQIFLGLDEGASFYDFVLALVDERGGVFAYDYAKASYRLSAAKDESGTPITLKPADIASLEVRFPEVPRYEVAVLNSYAAAPTNQAVTREDAAEGVRQDVLLRSPLAADADARVAQEKARLVTPQKRVRLVFSRFPTTALSPGLLVKLPATDDWAAAGVAGGETFRVVEVQATGAALSKDDQHGNPSAGYDARLTVLLEPLAETAVVFPAHASAFPPREVEGTIVSEVGEDGEETWKAYSDEATSLDQYRIKVPLFADQIVAAPFDPGLLPGHFYFPLAKAARVLLSMETYRTTILRSLEWRAGARMPADGEGVQLLMGKTTTSGTALQHSYTDGKPSFQVQRVNDKDKATIQMQEGTLRIQVKEDS